MILNKKPAYTFDDVLLRPCKSLASRVLADTSTHLFADPYVNLKVPIISANMNSITEVEMATAMFNAGGLGILHRYASIEKVVGWIKELVKRGAPPVIPSIGVFEEVYAEEAYWAAGARVICVDVANGYSDATFKRVETLHRKGWKVIAGNVATGEGARFLAEAGADIIKVGIGPGSVCTTRIVTGHGVPQLSAIMECYEELQISFDHVKIIADGGIRSSGDIVKALAAGADAVMVGGLFAGCVESATPNLYAGMASNTARSNGHRNGFVPKMSAAPEGVDVFIDNISRGDFVKDVMKTLEAGIKSGMSYAGARSLHELREFAEFQVITSNGVKESGAHFGL